MNEICYSNYTKNVWVGIFWNQLNTDALNTNHYDQRTTLLFIMFCVVMNLLQTQLILRDQIQCHALIAKEIRKHFYLCVIIGLLFINCFEDCEAHNKSNLTF